MQTLDHFEFSQSSLQDFTDCQRRFQLRYIQRIAWPAIQAEPARENERHIQRGERFHRLVQQFLLGVPEKKLASIADADEDPLIPQWWQNFLECIPAHLEGARYVEVSLAARLSRFRLVAKYDLVLATPNGRVVIYDWKTTPKRPQRARLLERLQTRVYPYLLVCAGDALNAGRHIEPEQVEMIYWFAQSGQLPESLLYNRESFEQDGKFLVDLVNKIGALDAGAFHMAEDERACSYCNYRSLCRRGTRAADLNDGEAEDDFTDAAEFSFDLEQIGEIRF